MSETTTTNSGRTPEEQQAWDAAVAASAEAQKPEDPPPRYFIEELDVELSQKERVDVAIKCADVRDEIDDFDIKTKADSAARKAERAKLLAHAKDLQGQTRTGRVRRKVRCAEYTSFAQNRKYKVRLDRKNAEGAHEEISETPLSTAERQGKLPLENTSPPEDASNNTSGADVSSADEGDEMEDEIDHDDDEDFEEEPSSLDSTMSITDPDALMDGSAATPSVPSKPSATPMKRSPKKKKN